MSWRLFQNLGPTHLTHCYDRVAETRLGLGVPGAGSGFYWFVAHEPGEDQAHNTEQSQQAWSGPQHALDRPVARRGKAQVSARFLEGHFDAPAAGVQADNSVGAIVVSVV